MAKRINSRVKGKRGELELAKALQALFGTTMRRGQQHSGLEGQDVVGLDGIHIECKRVESLQLYPAVAQSVRDAATGDGGVPAVFHRKNGAPWLVTIRLEDIKLLAKAVTAITDNSERPSNVDK